MLLLEGEVGGGETRGDQRREGDVEKKAERDQLWATLGVLVEGRK